MLFPQQEQKQEQHGIALEGQEQTQQQQEQQELEHSSAAAAAGTAPAAAAGGATTGSTTTNRNPKYFLGPIMEREGDTESVSADHAPVPFPRRRRLQGQAQS